MQWREITGEGSPPSPRDKLRSVAMGAKILFFGGFGPISDSSDVQSGQAEFSWFNDLYSFDTGDPFKASPYNFARYRQNTKRTQCWILSCFNGSNII